MIGGTTQVTIFGIRPRTFPRVDTDCTSAARIREQTQSNPRMVVVPWLNSKFDQGTMKWYGGKDGSKEIRRRFSSAHKLPSKPKEEDKRGHYGAGSKQKVCRDFAWLFEALQDWKDGSTGSVTGQENSPLQLHLHVSVPSDRNVAVKKRKAI